VEPAAYEMQAVSPQSDSMAILAWPPTETSWCMRLRPGSTKADHNLFGGDRLTLVHYCEAGNRLRMVARKSPDQKTVAFDFVDISGSLSPAYLHHFVFRSSGRGPHTEDWTFTLSGDKLLNAHSDLKRAKKSVPPSAGK
jgi:hypothetical protein